MPAPGAAVPVRCRGKHPPQRSRFEAGGKGMMLYALDVFGTFVFAVSGAFRALKHELDLLGMMVLATATGIGGGIIRDLLLGAARPAAFRNETYLLACLAGGLAVFFAARKIAPRWDCVMAADAVGLSVFAAIGAEEAASSGFGALGIVMMAAITATGGGLIRDVLVREIPVVLKTDFYATAALAGGACLVASRAAGFSVRFQILSAALTAFVLRVAAMRYGISLPRVRRLAHSPSRLTMIRKGAHDAGKAERDEKGRLDPLSGRPPRFGSERTRG